MSEEKHESIKIKEIKELIVNAGVLEVRCPTGNIFDCEILLDGKVINFATKVTIILEADKPIFASIDIETFNIKEEEHENMHDK